MPNLLRQLMMQNRLMNADPVDPGPGAPTPAPAAPVAGKETFSREYVQELRQENASYRTRAIEAERKAQEAEAKATKAAEEADAKAKKASDDADAKVKDTHTSAEQRIIRAELKAEAIKAGMVDLDGLKLADLSSIKIDEKGDIQGAAELMATLKESKPYLFKEPASSTSHAGDPPPKKKPEPFDARKATPEELKAKAREMGLKIKQ
ncbi:hypothetical protein AB4Y32_16005 [Paraburkholderia phymatum]|uniref:Uncharacterized protein n=1 Tax=Paraburkholderia phymatum TaxID=148447 RepID=A0ACC6U0P7_9BURK